MKRILVIFAILATSTAGFAQNLCSNGDPFFNFDNGAKFSEIHTLGSNPEFPFVKHLATAQQVYDAIKRNENRENYKTRMDELNKMMVSIGFNNGIDDMTASSITAANIPSGSEGNMGSGSGTTGYYKLTGDPDGYKAWKITSGTGCYVYLLAACGNAFYPNPNAGKTACVSTSVNVTSHPKEITVGTTPDAMVSDKTYVYYHVGKYRRHDSSYASPAIKDPTPSRPLLLSVTKRVEANPETYKVTVSTTPADSNMNVCLGQPVDVPTDIDVEKISSFTGNYPDAAQQGYKEVSKREYMRAERKMRKVEKKETKVSNITGVTVEKLDEE